MRRILCAVAVLAAVLVLGPTPSASAGADIDSYLCEELGIGCPDGDGALVCTSPLAQGASGTCTLSGVDPAPNGDAAKTAAGSGLNQATGGTPFQSVLDCGGVQTVVFSGNATSDPYNYPFTVPSDAQLGTCTMTANGKTTTITVIGATGGASPSLLARTGSDIGPLLGVGASLLVIGAAAVYGTRSRRQQQS